MRKCPYRLRLQLLQYRSPPLIRWAQFQGDLSVASSLSVFPLLSQQVREVEMSVRVVGPEAHGGAECCDRADVVAQILENEAEIEVGESVVRTQGHSFAEASDGRRVLVLPVQHQAESELGVGRV